MDENRMWQRLAAEFLGTAFLVFVGVGSVPALAIARGDQPFTGSELGFISLSFGAVVIGTVYVFGYISGNHINPAVTVALAVTGKFPWRDVPGYLGAQVLGAVAGSFAIIAVLGQKASELGLGVAAYGDIPVWQAFTAEFIGTFILVFTVFGVIHRKAAPGFAGIVIGFIVFAAIIPVAPVTGASINPARTTGPMLVQSLMGGTVHWEQWPVYVIAEIAAGIAAGLLFGLISRTQADSTSLTEALTEQESRA
ncbi:MIP/aquaporin family protein [Arthrobacter sp. 4R501]|uniref:MIP/aquaporin family protein n=1 Tax=Arthrobacter sp. 4R501 TaxID=2058886 RepID=UPI000CE4EEDE|nr:MIP/aquaporin family protein [Arthrobacter sp. 4R501]